MAAKRKSPKKKASKKKSSPSKARGAKPAKKAASKKAARRTAARPAKAKKPAKKKRVVARAKPVAKAKAVAKAKPARKAAKPAARPSAKTRTTKLAKAPKVAATPQKYGRFVWHDLVSTDVPRSLDFYRRVFGWTGKPMDMGGGKVYHLLSSDGRDFGGVMAPNEPGQPSTWMGYVSVRNVDAAVRAAQAAGGTILMPGTDIPNVGRFAAIADPLGAVTCPLSLDNPTPGDPDARPGFGQVSWNELVTTDPGSVKSFYGKVYGWTVGEMDMGPMGTYYLFRDGAKDLGGMMKMPSSAPAGSPPMWLSYVAVADTDRTLEGAVAAGATVGMAAFDVPGVGRLAMFIDPQGAMIALLTPSMS